MAEFCTAALPVHSTYCRCGGVFVRLCTQVGRSGWVKQLLFTTGTRVAEYCCCMHDRRLGGSERSDPNWEIVSFCPFVCSCVRSCVRKIFGTGIGLAEISCLPSFPFSLFARALFPFPFRFRLFFFPFLFAFSRFAFSLFCVLSFCFLF